VLVDGDMEDGGVAAWPVTRLTPTVTKETSSPYAGARVLRVASAADNGAVGQPVMTIGTRYRLTGRARGDGTGRPGVYVNVTGYVFTGTSSTDWQEIDATFNAGGATLELFNLDAGQAADFDALVLVLA
jgi:hypothetical protein